MEYCNRCGKEMTDENGISIIGISLSIKPYEPPGIVDGPEVIGVDATSTKDGNLGFYQKQLGKYEVGKRYQFCWECWLDSLFGVVPFRHTFTEV